MNSNISTLSNYNSKQLAFSFVKVWANKNYFIWLNLNHSGDNIPEVCTHYCTKYKVITILQVNKILPQCSDTNQHDQHATKINTHTHSERERERERERESLRFQFERWEWVSFWWWKCSIRYSCPRAPPPPPIPLPPFPHTQRQTDIKDLNHQWNQISH